ncbi:hypothetical protein FCM35_KLT16998 [Carex littledalei]|uniref:protein-serine/threonine phosphatase n=1 Tax=Carex littledalei TaxID=544730 RepID=A0A833RE17_9POAL|nr:hypothetical protein FCM35_KLT16998 [Carex littledalei]
MDCEPKELQFLSLVGIFRESVSGSCCLVGVVYNNVLYVANAGHSRAVLVSWPDGGGWNDLEVIQLWVAGRGWLE